MRLPSKPSASQQTISTSHSQGHSSPARCSIPSSAAAVALLAPELDERIDKAGLRQLLDEVELPLSSVLARMQANGVALDVAYLEDMAEGVRDKMAIERDGHTVATVRKALVSPLRDRFSIDVEGGQDMEAKGNIVDHEYKVERGGDRVAEVSKRWFRVRDTYGIEIAPGQDDPLLLAVVVCIDQMTRG